MKSLVNYINENFNHDAEKYADEMIKKYKNKTVKLDDFVKDVKDNFYWEYDEEGSNDNELYFWGNFTNNAEGDDSSMTVMVKRNGDNIKILSYDIE